MDDYKDFESFLVELKAQLKKQMPKIREEIRVYEEKLASGNLTTNPAPAPQFNG